MNGCYAEELGSVAGGAHDLDSGFDTDVAQERSRGVGDAGVGYKKRFRGREGSDVRVGPPREVGAVELALRNSSTRKTKYILEPVVGTSFDSLAEAHEFYNLYSWEVGFGIRYGKNYTNGKNYRSSQQLICQMEGIDKRDKNDSARCGCKAMIRMHRSDDDGWFVETNRPDHNHILSDNCGEKMQWNSHKKIDQATKDNVRYLRENNVSLSKVHCILGSMHKSGDRLPFTKKSLRTVCQQIAFDQKDDDIKKTIDLFRSMRSTDPDFAFRFDLDPDGRIKNLIWTSGRSRRQYTCFGDVVVFDTTYTTNLYKMPFGLFVGVNNHFQIVIYAGILMSEETIEGFNWAYKEFVSLMGGKAPLTMLTGEAWMDSDGDFYEPQVPLDDDVCVLIGHSQFGASPFLLGLFHPKACPSLCRYLMKMVEKTDAVEALRTWFRHDQPTEIAISCSELRCAFYRDGRYSVLVVDGLTRCYTILDMLMYKANGVLENMWRHWMPASFATAVIDGEDFLSPRFRDMLVGDHLGCNVANCRMLIMSLPKNGRWCSYVWDFLQRIITVLDPYHQQTDVGRMGWEHDDTMDCLHQALFDCKDAWIPGWGVDRHNWRHNHPIALGRRCRDYNTGVYTMHYALHFDGDDVTDLSVEADHVLVRAGQLYKLMTMPGHTGDIPAFLPKVAG